jgi:hypothetical protein
LKGQERMPVMKTQRAFIAAEVYSATLSKECTTSAVVFMVKSSRFTGDINDVDWLHKDLLRHHIVQGARTFEFNINGRLLEMVVEVGDGKSTSINVKLRETRKYIEYIPVFHRVNSFA